MIFFFFFFKQKTAYDMRISDWSSDVCSSYLERDGDEMRVADRAAVEHIGPHSIRQQAPGNRRRGIRGVEGQRQVDHVVVEHLPLHFGIGRKSLSADRKSVV